MSLKSQGPFFAGEQNKDNLLAQLLRAIDQQRIGLYHESASQYDAKCRSGAWRLHRRCEAATEDRRAKMPYYLMLTNLTDEGRKTIKAYPRRIHEVTEEVEGMGVKVTMAAIPLSDFIASLEK